MHDPGLDFTELQNGTGNWQNIQPIVREAVKTLAESFSRYQADAREADNRFLALSDEVKCISTNVNVLSAKLKESTLNSQSQSNEWMVSRQE